MDPRLNPYAPGAGAPPPALVGREAVLDDAGIALARTLSGRHAKGQILLGLRGVGKTVLLNRIETMAGEEGLQSILVEAPEGRGLPDILVPPLRRVLLRLDRGERVQAEVKRALGTLRSFASAFTVSVGPLEFGVDAEPGQADSGDLEFDLPDLLLSAATAAKARGTGIALLIDEVQYLSGADLSALIVAVHRVTQKSLPLVFFGAGLPQIAGLAGEAKSYAERLFDYPPVEALAAADAVGALREPALREDVAYEPAALDAIVEQTQGYPYFLQEWGKHAWNVADASPITAADAAAATDRALRGLDDSFFRVRLDRLTPREKDYLRAMADLGPGPHRSGEIADALDVRVQSVAPLRHKLIQKGMVYSPAHGDTAFTVPMFDEFMRRTMPWPPTDG